MFLVLYLLALAALAVHASPIIWQPGAREFVIILGLFGAWRYSWGAVHLARADLPPPGVPGLAPRRRARRRGAARLPGLRRDHQLPDPRRDHDPGLSGGVRRPGTGKRHSMACALRAISRDGPNADAAVMVVDGDTLLSEGMLARRLPFLTLMPDVDGITTDEDCLVAGGRVMQAWHELRLPSATS